MRGRRSASLFGPLSHPQGRSAPERPHASSVGKMRCAQAGKAL